MKAVSCGIIIRNIDGLILLGQVTGQEVWSIPKGKKEPDETDIQTAIRETIEECGLACSPEDLRHLGKFSYTKTKELSLFELLDRGKALPLSEYKCYSRIADSEKFEFSKFAYVSEENLPSFVSPKMLATLTRALEKTREKS